MPRPSPRNHGFTLIELLVVIAIISVLAALLIPAVKGAIKKSQYVAASNNMRQIGIAFRGFSNENEGQLPGRAGPNTTGDKWPKLLVDYLVPNTTTVTADNFNRFKVYTDPTDEFNAFKEAQASGLPFTDVLYNDGNKTSFIMNGYNDVGDPADPLNSAISVRISSIREPSNTILLGVPEAGSTHYYMDFAEGGGNNNEVLNLKAHGAGSHYVMADGSVRFISEADYKAVTPQSNGLTYGDWLWLVDKDRTDIVQPPP